MAYIEEPDSGSEDYASPDTHNDQELDEQDQAPLTPASPRKPPSELKTIPCPYEDCLKTFNRPARLKDHIRSHTNERPFVCSFEECRKTFRRDTHLKHHFKSAHTNERNYKCEWEGCEKRFLTATRLKRHYAVHEGREKYRVTHLTCALCDCNANHYVNSVRNTLLATRPFESMQPFKDTLLQYT